MMQPGPTVDGDGGSWAMVVALCSMFVNAIGLVVGWVWTAGRMRNATDEKIAEKEKAAIADLTAAERRLESRFGETVTAIRSKVMEIELWNRDNFVSKATFQLFVSDFRRSFERLEDNIKEGFAAINEKLDARNKSD